MKSDQRGGVLVRVLLSLGAIAVLVAAGLWLVYRQEELTGRLVLAEEALRREAAARQSLTSEVERARELYELVGSELSSRDEEFSKVLSRAVTGRDGQLTDVRRRLDSIDTVLGEFRHELEAIREESSHSAEELSARTAAVRDSVNLALTDLNSLRSRLEAAAEELSKQLQSLPKPEPLERQWVLELDSAQSRRISAIEKQVADDLVWLKAEIDRLRRDTDSLGHQLSRLESRR